MKNTEIRIGNYVLDIAKQESKILEIRKDNVVLDTDDGEYVNELLDLYPIPLTLEWLLSFGFKQSSIIINEYSIDWFRIQLNNAILFECNEVCLDKKRFTYVHELQNFYYITTGNELERNVEIVNI